MDKQEKYNAVIRGYKWHKRADGSEIYIINESLPESVQEILKEIQRDLGVSFEESYNVMADACGIIDDLGYDKVTGNIDDLDLFAEADSRANVYTAVQLSYLNVENESEISELIKDEAITSIAQACAIWRVEKVQNACEQLINYINQ